MYKNKEIGKLVAFDGPNGSGKSTLIMAVQARLSEMNIDVHVTKEPIDGLSEQDFYATLKEYFSLHASQRMHMLNFYIVLETFLMTAWLTLFQVIDGLNVVRIILSISAIFISICLLYLRC